LSPYLVDAPDIFVESRTKPISNVPEMINGNRPTDGGNLIVEADDYNNLLKQEPNAAQYVRRFMGSEEFINDKKRHCLWLLGADPVELRKMPLIMERVGKCRQSRLSSTKKTTRDCAETPSLFQEIRQPKTHYLAVPEVSSEKRRYIPIGYLSPDVIASNKLHVVPNATLYHFGILTSNVHMAWVRVVCGRLKSDYDYSKNIVYNNFPWPDASEAQKTAIEKLAQAILDARSLFPASSLADLYDPLTMPPQLLKAHKTLDTAVMKLYGFPAAMPEAAVVAALMGRYQKIVVR